MTPRRPKEPTYKNLNYCNYFKGANIAGFKKVADAMLAQVGERNVEETKRQLALLSIPIVAEDTGERHARTVELRLDSGVYVVRSYQYGVKRL